MNRLTPCLIAAILAAGCTTGTISEVAGPAAAESKKAPGPAQHAAIGAKVTASSTHAGETGEGHAANLVDGKMDTRWSSKYAEPQQITIQLDKRKTLTRLRLHWEDAAAKNYSVSVSPDGKEWTTVGTKSAKGLGPRTDEFTLKNLPVHSIRLDLQHRANKRWGFSLYEVEAIAD